MSRGLNSAIVILVLLAVLPAQAEEKPRRWKWIPPEKKETKTQEIEFPADSQHILVEVLINKAAKATLVLDTGASTVFISNRIAKALGIPTYTTEDELTEVQLADGRKAEAKYITLDSVVVEDLEAKDVAAVVLLNEKDEVFADGLLGMSFLKNFNFQIDNENKKLILQEK